MSDEITDMDIVRLWDSLLAEDIRSITGFEVRECRIALGIINASSTGTTPKRRAEARARCAAILAARRSR